MSNPGLKRLHSSARRDRGVIDERLHACDKPTAMSNEKSRSSFLGKQQAHPALFVTETEFQSLPPSVQRKYFSTLERLQILHYSANVYAYDSPPKNRSRPRTSATASRPATSTSLASSIRRRKHRNSLNLGRFDVKAETDFYLSLPDKIRRQQFSKEEQIRIQSQLEAGAPLAIPRSSQGSRRPSTTSSAKHSRRLSLSGHSALRKDSKVPSIEIPRPVTAPMNCFEKSKSTRVDSRRPSLLKDASFHRPTSSILSPKSQYSSPTLCSPTSPTFPHHQRQMSSRTVTMVRPSIDSNLSIDAAATYYQDPEARKKLRKYLASPQKFDEAVEFGFQSLPARNSTCERDSAVRAVAFANSTNDAQRFLQNDRVEILDHRYSVGSSDGDTASCNDSPVTPASGEDLPPRVRPYGASIFNGLDKSDLPSLRFNFDGMSDIDDVDTDHDPSAYDPLANREMTLRMTLTRPELRATEEELYGWGGSQEKDPLALESLHLSDDVTGQNGAFAIKPSASTRSRRSGVFKRIFGRVTTR